MMKLYRETDEPTGVVSTDPTANTSFHGLFRVLQYGIAQEQPIDVSVGRSTKTW